MTTQHKAMTWTGWIITVGLSALIGMSAVMKLTKQQMVMEQLGKAGYSEATIVGIGIAEAASVALFLLPPTSILGAVLLTGYLGGAINTHVHAGENFAGPAAFGVLVWLAMFLRDARVRALLPIRW